MDDFRVKKGLLTMKGSAKQLDPYFKARPDFKISDRDWELDAACDWKNLDDHTLVEHYQDHLEAYCRGCRYLEYTPTIDGFRIYLKLIERRRQRLRQLGEADDVV